ncbi:MAG: hypothetical protein ABSF12_23630 [Bryobacteraceae bacterium]
MSRAEDLFNVLHHCVVFQQLSPPRGLPTCLHGLKEANLVFQLSVDSFLHGNELLN